VRRFSLASLFTVVALMGSASPAGAAATIGQVAPTTPEGLDCGGNSDRVQPTVTSGNTYIVPTGTGEITSWSTNAEATAGQMLTMKVFRKVADPATYQVVGHDGPRPLDSGVLNTFPASLAVQSGDVLGLHVPSPGGQACFFSAPGETFLLRVGNLADGQSDVFTTQGANFRLNVSAVIEPDCDNDGLGDETQDTDLSSCAPGTTPTGPAPTLPSGAPATCKGQPATMLGTEGNDVRTGSQGPDVIVALGGNDTLSGLAGNDVICGGRGKDTLKGGGAQDTLLGQKGKDRLKGGGGADLCKGGKGKDTASKCEVEKSI
jgi:RTX calcium-binding nonapeptide repeat (4 copies)